MTSEKKAKTPLQKAIQETGMPQIWVATQLGIDPAQLSKMCCGWAPGTDEQRHQIAQLLQLPERMIFPSVEANHRSKFPGERGES